MNSQPDRPISTLHEEPSAGVDGNLRTAQVLSFVRKRSEGLLLAASIIQIMISCPEPHILEIYSCSLLGDMHAQESSNTALIHGQWWSVDIRRDRAVVELEVRTSKATCIMSVYTCCTTLITYRFECGRPITPTENLEELED